MLHASTFDVVRSHGLKLIGLIHNENQDMKTEIYYSFYHLKFQLKNYDMKTKGSVLTPQGMARVMECSNGTSNSRFDMIQFSCNRLDELLYDHRNYCGKLKTRVKQVLP